MNGALDAAVGDLDVERVAFSDLCGGENGFAVRADDGEAQPQDTLRGASGDQFGRIAEPGRLACEEIPGTGREGFAHLLQGHPPLSEQPLGMEEQVAAGTLKTLLPAIPDQEVPDTG